MKNILIGLLVLAIGVMGFLLFNEDNSNSTKSTDNESADSTSTVSEEPVESAGKTINLSNTGISEVPRDILDDDKVITLDVSGNSLTGALPAEIRKLTNLEVLIASDNNMTGIPAEIGQLSKLRIANFANNNLSGLPLELGNLSNLETFDLRGNPNISDNDLSQIKKEIPNATILTD